MHRHVFLKMKAGLLHGSLIKKESQFCESLFDVMKDQTIDAAHPGRIRGSIFPEILLQEQSAMRKPYSQCCIDILYRTFEAKDDRFPLWIRQIRISACGLRRKDQVVSIICLLKQRNFVAQQIFYHCNKQESLLLFISNTLISRHSKMTGTNILFSNTAQPIWFIPHCIHKSRSICIEQFRLQQHQIAEAESSNQP